MRGGHICKRDILAMAGFTGMDGVVEAGGKIRNRE
jgi:hypothetical protein